MHAFDRTENAPSLLDAVEVPEPGAPVTTGELNPQEAAATRIVAETQECIGDLETETARHREIIAATHAEQVRRVAAVREGRERLEELMEELEGAQYELAVVHSPILLLPYELMVEIFDWHMLMGGSSAATLLVCKRWTIMAYNAPQLWSRITVTNIPFHRHRLRGSVLCTDLDYLRLVLSRSQSCPLQVEISFRSVVLAPKINRSGRASLMRGPQATANRINAVKLVLGDQILRRCTSLFLAKRSLPFNYQNTTVLPLLSSIQVCSAGAQEHELMFIQSLVNSSPALRHVRCNRSLSAESWIVGLWTKTIETYGWIFPSTPCSPLHESPSLRRLGVHRDIAVPLTLPALQVLRWSIHIYSALHRITAPHLHTLILRHGPLDKPESAGSISFPNLRVAIHTWVYAPTSLHMFHTPALEHLSIEYLSSASSPTALLELFDGWIHMPTPKSLYLDCTFTDAALITVLGRLSWLEELRIAGTGVLDTFWEGLTPLCNPSWQASLPNENADENATYILLPSLKVLLVNYPTSMEYNPPAPDQQSEMALVPKDPNDGPSGGDWTVSWALALATAREQAGCPLRTLACWSPEQTVEVLIGSLDDLPKRPKFVSLAVLWCYYGVLMLLLTDGMMIGQLSRRLITISVDLESENGWLITASYSSVSFLNVMDWH